MMNPMPDNTREAIDDYVKYGECGDFLEAVLTNNLTEAVRRADDHNLEALPAIVRYAYNHIPAECWGSREKIKAWRDARRAERAAADLRKLIDEAKEGAQ